MSQGTKRKEVSMDEERPICGEIQVPPLLKRPAEADESPSASPVTKKLKESEGSVASPSVSAGSETPASNAHTAAKSKKSNNKSIFQQIFAGDGHSKAVDPASSPQNPSAQAHIVDANEAVLRAKPAAGAGKGKGNEGNRGGVGKGKGGAESKASSSKKKPLAAPLLAELRKQVLGVGGKEALCKGWKVVSAAQPAAGKKAVLSSKAAKKARVCYVSPQGNKFESVQAVMKHLGLVGLSRANAFLQAQAFRQENGCPFTIKMQQGQLTVQALGNLMVEKGPNEPTFHDKDNLYPIGFKSQYVEGESGIIFENSILDGMDVFKEDAPAFQVRVRVQGRSANEFVGKRPQAVWKLVKKHLEDNGTDQEKEVAKGWNSTALHYKFGLGSKEVRKRLEGLSGAMDCFKYKFMEEATCAPNAVGAESKSKKPKIAKNTSPSLDHADEDRDENLRKKASKSGEGEGEGEDSMAAFKNKNKKPPRQATGYKLYSKDVIGEVKQEKPEISTGELIKIIKGMYASLDEGKRQEFEKKAADINARQAEQREEAGPASGNDENEVSEDKDDKDDKGGGEKEEDSTVWRTEGSQYIGKRVRRYVFDSRNRLIDAADGVVVGWLDKDESDYLAEKTDEPSPLWHMTYDDARIGSEDLEEEEVREAIELLDQELPEKVKARYLKRQEVIAAQQAKKKEKEEKAKAREDAKMLKALQQLEKEAQRKEREKLREKTQTAKTEGGEKESKTEEKKAPEPVKDEADVLLESGKWKGMRAGDVASPAGSQEVFPPASLSDDFISIYTFLHDLSAPLGAAKMQLEDVLGCLMSPSDDDTAMEVDNDGSVESFYEVAKWLTELASRGLWIRDSDEDCLDEARNRDVCDIALAAGPLLSASASDSTVKYSCWQLLNEASWPEIARILLMRRTEVIKDASLVELCEILAVMEPGDLAVEQKVKLLRFLCDEASAGDRVHRVLNDKLKQIDRILDKKRVEDVALKNKIGAPRKASKAKLAAVASNGEAGEGAKENEGAGAEAAAGEEAQGENGGGAKTTGRPEGARTCWDVMLFLDEKNPGATFEIRHKGVTYPGSIDKSTLVPRIRCNGKDYDTVAQWIKSTTDMKKFAAKLMVHYDNQKIKNLEDKLEFPLEDKNKLNSRKEVSQVDALMSELRDESLANIDTERRKREIETALKRAKKGLRYGPVGYDRWHRSYWCFDGIVDRVWVRSSFASGRQESPLVANQRGPEGGNSMEGHAVVAGCWTSSTNFGFDGLPSEEYKKLGKEAETSTASDWIVYYKNDGSLQALCELLVEGPHGKRETALLAALREHGFLDSSDGVDDKEGARLSRTTSPVNKDAENTDTSSGDVEMKDADGKPVRGARGVGPVKKEEEEGYEWNELPVIGDLVWARLGEAHKRAWYPVVVVEPPAMPSMDDDAQTESDDDEDQDDEWQHTGSEYLGKRLLIEVLDRRGDVRLLPGRITGWLPKEVADFKNEATGEPAALWRAKLEDRTLNFQDLEEYEVKDGLLRLMREEAKKKNEASQVLSSRSMFGQTIKKVYTRLFNDDEDVEVLPLSDLQPFQQFKEQHEQEMRRAGKTKALQQVKLANRYLEEHGSSSDQLEERSDLMRQLGIKLPTEGDLAADMKAATQHCAHFPRILNVVQDNREAMPWITSTKELRAQLQAIQSKLLLSAQLHEKLNKRLSVCKEKADAAKTRSELVDSIKQLEGVLHEIWLDKEQAHQDHVDLDEWRTEGHEYLGRRIRRPIKGSFGRVVKFTEARIVGWLPAEESDYKNDKDQPAALWHILWNDGVEEDLEEWEVAESLEMSAEDDEDLLDGGIWSSGRDRKEWLSLIANCRTVGATALALYLLGDRALPMVAALCQTLLHAADESDDHCFVCFDGGKLLCCDGCPRTVHFQCVGLPRAPREKDPFFCFHCLKDQKNTKAKSKDKNPDNKPVSKSGGGGSKKREEEPSGASRAMRSKADKDDKGPTGKTIKAQPVNRDKLHKDLKRMGAVNGSIIEVAKEGVPLSVFSDERRATRDERYFAFVHDGDVINKTTEPALKGVQFYPPWRPREQNKLRLQDGDKQVVELPINFILVCGSAAQLFVGEARRGFTPADE